MQLPSKDNSVVWILGAGFSRPLGLPLAGELFTERFGRIGEGFAAPMIYTQFRLRRDLEPLFKRVKDRFEKGDRDKVALAAGDLLGEVTLRCHDARSALKVFPSKDERVSDYLELVERYERDAQRICKRCTETFADVSLYSGMVTEIDAFLSRWDTERSPFEVPGLERVIQQTRSGLEHARRTIKSQNANEEMSPEEILASLDLASKGDVAHQRIWFDESEIQRGGREVRTDLAAQCRGILENATRLVVAELEASMPGEDEEPSHKWAPYVRWATELVGSKDVIITFNYDRVVETAFRLAQMELAVGTHDPRVPAPLLLKMHGSVTDSKENEMRTLNDEGLRRQILGLDLFFTIKLGLPGESKSYARRSGNYLATTWGAAAEAIKDAHEYVFVGYSLPADDVEAMEMIVEALRERGHEPTAKASLVLGGDSQNAELIKSIISPYCDAEDSRQRTEHMMITWARAEDSEPPEVGSQL